MDLHNSNERFGSNSDPSINGHLHYPNNLDGPLNEAVPDKILLVPDKIRQYHTDYNNCPSKSISFILSFLVRLSVYIVNLCVFYSYILIGKLTAFLYLQEFNLRDLTVTSSTTTV